MVIVFFELMAHLLVLLVVSTIEYKIGGSSVASASIKHVKCMRRDAGSRVTNTTSY